MKKIIMCLIMVAISSFGFGQTNTLFLEENEHSPKATIEALSWIAGHWRGEAFGGITEEIWSPPLGGGIMGSFRAIKDNKITFYEIETITEENGSLILKLKHFSANLIGWEEKDETVDFRLVKITDNKVYFDGFTFEKVSVDEINTYVVIDEVETKFNFLRYRE